MSGVFREKSIKRVNQPEDLDDYIPVPKAVTTAPMGMNSVGCF